MKFERLGSIIGIQKGKKPSFVEIPSKTSVRVLQIDDLRNDKNIKYTDDKTGVLAKESDILIAWDGANAGTIGYGKSGYIGSTIALLRIKDLKKYSTIYIGIFLQTQYDFLRSKSTGATIPHINRKTLEELRIPAIEVTQQLHISNALSKAENLIANRQESIALLNEYLKSTFLEMFGDPGTNPKKWDISKLEKSFLVKPLIGSMVPAIENGTVPIVRVGELGKREIDFQNCKFSNLNREDLEKYRLKGGDILLARAIGSISHLGKASIFIDKGNLAVYDSHVMRVRFDETKIHPEYFYMFLQTSGGRKRFMQKGGQTSVQFNINSKQISDIDIPIPPIELQYQFAQIVEKTETLKVLYRISLLELKNLYGCLSQMAFKGELITTTQPLINEQKSQELEEKYFLKRKVLATYIINQSLNDPQFGDVKFEKLLHLSEYFTIKRNLNQNYLQKAAGPYDNAFTIPFFKQIESSKWFLRTKKGAQYIFKPGSKHRSSINTYEYFTDGELQGVDKLIAYFKKSDYKQPEIISTLYAVWNNRIIRQQPTTDELLKIDFLNWDGQKVKYKDRLDAALQWMRKEGLVPDGWGKVIDKPKSKNNGKK